MFRETTVNKTKSLLCSLHLMEEFPFPFSYSFFHHCAVLNSSCSVSSAKKYLIYKGVEIIDQKCYLWIYFYHSYLIIISTDSFSVDLKRGWKTIFQIHRCLKKLLFGAEFQRKYKWKAVFERLTYLADRWLEAREIDGDWIWTEM